MPRKVLAWSRRVPWRKVLARSGLVVAVAGVVVAGIYAIFWPLSDLIARHDVGAIIGPHRTAALQQHAAALQAARDAARGRVVAFGAGLFAAGALVYTARNFSLSRQGQVTDRYTKASPPGVQLPGPNLTGAKLYGAVWPPHAEEPEGWQRDPSGGLRPTTPDSGTAAAD